MCRLLGYIGEPIELNHLLYKPEHSLIHQSYQPREMTSGLLNADGFGLGWYHAFKNTLPYTYKNILPIWNDGNLPQLSRYIETGCALGYVRSATPPLAVDFTNSQPFTRERILFIHNGYIDNFRKTLYRPIRTLLNDDIYQYINGTTDSEHIFALILTKWQNLTGHSLLLALQSSLEQLQEMAEKENVYFSANIILSDGEQLIASRYADRSPVPSLYWLRDDPNYPGSVIVASEPLFEGDWKALAENSLIRVGKNLEVSIYPIR